MHSTEDSITKGSQRNQYLDSFYNSIYKKSEGVKQEEYEQPFIVLV